MTKSQEELREEYRLQFEEDDRAFDAVMEALRLVKIVDTSDALVTGMNAAGYTDTEINAACKMILWSAAVNERRRT
jgi:formiminotetrahydrofolate cyclodeaminase